MYYPFSRVFSRPQSSVLSFFIVYTVHFYDISLSYTNALVAAGEKIPTKSTIPLKRKAEEISNVENKVPDNLSRSISARTDAEAQ